MGPKGAAPQTIGEQDHAVVPCAFVLGFERPTHDRFNMQHTEEPGRDDCTVEPGRFPRPCQRGLRRCESGDCIEGTIRVAE